VTARKTPGPWICDRCGNPLPPRYQRYCSADCRVQGKAAERRVIRHCAWCQVQLTGRRKRFCSDRCKYKGQKRERVIETSDYGKGTIARIRKMAERADGNLEVLPWLAAIAEASRETLAAAVDGSRTHGHSDAEIGQALGITRQAVWKRFPRQPKVDTETTGTGGTA